MAMDRPKFPRFKTLKWSVPSASFFSKIYYSVIITAQRIQWFKSILKYHVKIHLLLLVPLKLFKKAERLKRLTLVGILSLSESVSFFLVRRCQIFPLQFQAIVSCAFMTSKFGKFYANWNRCSQLNILKPKNSQNIIKNYWLSQRLNTWLYKLFFNDFI